LFLIAFTFVLCLGEGRSNQPSRSACVVRSLPKAAALLALALRRNTLPAIGTSPSKTGPKSKKVDKLPRTEGYSKAA
jgi:hypothetical protein